MRKFTSVKIILFLFLFISVPYFSYAQNWAWAKSAGGAMKVESYAIAIDNAGNSYITGYFEDSLKFGTTTLFSSGSNPFVSNIFIAKYDINGNFVWAQKAGGNNYDYGTGIATDAVGNVYVTGLFTGTATFGTLSITSSTTDYDVFIAKYSPTGTALWVNKGGGSGWDVGSGVTIDNAGNCFITGSYRNTGTFGTTSFTSAGNYDAFVAKYDSNGTFLWAKSAGGTLEDKALSIGTDITGNCYVSGFFNGTATIGTATLISSGNSDIWLAKYDNAGNFIWAKQAGGNQADEGKYLVTDAAGNSFMTGYFGGSALFGSGSNTVTLTSYGSEDIFVGKFDYKGDIVWVKNYGGTLSDKAFAISIDTAGHSYIAGSFFGTAQFDTITAISSNQDDAFVAGLDNLGKAKFVVQGGGANADVGSGIATSLFGSCYTTGYFNGTVSFGSIPLISSGDNDLFIAKIDSAFIANQPNNINDAAALILDNLDVFPNPSNLDVTIQFELNKTKAQINIELYDVLGKLVTDKVIISELKSFSNKKQIVISRNNLPDGLYFGKIMVDNKLYTTRILFMNNASQH